MANSNLKSLLENPDALPDMCYSTLISSGEVILIKRGEHGYYSTDFGFMGEKAEETVRMCNEKLGVTPEQQEAMMICSMSRW